jgi:hypothetical protein
MGIYVIISAFMGFCGFVDSARQPRRAWRNAGKSKSLWVLINLIGMLSIYGGAMTFLAYTYGGTRKAVVNSGGVNRPGDEIRGPGQVQGNVNLLLFLSATAVRPGAG